MDLSHDMECVPGQGAKLVVTLPAVGDLHREPGFPGSRPDHAVGVQAELALPRHARLAAALG